MDLLLTVLVAVAAAGAGDARVDSVHLAGVAAQARDAGAAVDVGADTAIGTAWELGRCAGGKCREGSILSGLHCA